MSTIPDMATCPACDVFTIMRRSNIPGLFICSACGAQDLTVNQLGGMQSMLNSGFGAYHMGKPVYLNQSLGTWDTRVRSWRERLFARPWRPRQKIERTFAADQQVYEIRGLGYVMHPLTWERLKRSLATMPKEEPTS